MAERRLITVAEVARRMECSPEVVTRLVGTGDLNAIRFGRLLKISVSSMERFLADGGGAGIPRIPSPLPEPIEVTGF
jgi:excisionase family DNA binding protein